MSLQNLMYQCRQRKYKAVIHHLNYVSTLSAADSLVHGLSARLS